MTESEISAAVLADPDKDGKHQASRAEFFRVDPSIEKLPVDETFGKLIVRRALWILFIR